MNWIIVAIVGLPLLAVLEILRRGQSKPGHFIRDRLRTFSARLTVSFLTSFIVAAGLSSALTTGPRLVLMLMTAAVVAANFMRQENRET